MMRVSLAALFVMAVFPALAAAAEQRVSVGSGQALRKFNDLEHHELTYSLPWPARADDGWIPDELRFGAGLFQRDGEQGHIFSLGPAWRRNLDLPGCRCFFDTGIVLAWLDRPRFYNSYTGEVENFGEEWQFISHLAFGWQVDREWAVAVSLQHVSNGGLSDVNPGTEFLVLEIQYVY